MKLARRQSREAGFDAGATVAGYVVTRAVSGGGTGEAVYEAKAGDGLAATIVAGHGRYAALENPARFRRLARLRAEIEHPGLLRVRDWGEHDGTPFFVTDPYPAGTLTGLLEGGPMAPERALAVLAPVAGALDACHSGGLVHQLLTDQSILLDSDQAVLDTFAIAAGDAVRTWDTLAARDLRYGTPEAMRGEAVEPASNVYSLTALLVHLLTGHAPYEGADSAPSNLAWAVGVLHLSEPPPRVSERLPELGTDIDGVVAWGMAKDPSDRPQTAGSLLEAASQALGVPAPAPAPAGLAPATAPQRSDARTQAAPAAASVPAAAPAGADPNTRSARRRPPRRRSRSRLLLTAAIAAVAVAGLVAGAVVDPFGGESPEAQPARPASASAPAVARLDAERTALRSELAAASTPQEQSAIAAELSAAYDEFAASARPGRLAGAARAAAAAYAQMADAAEGGDFAAYAEARAEVAAADGRFAVLTRQ